MDMLSSDHPLGPVVPFAWGHQLFPSEPSHAADDCARGIPMPAGGDHHRDPHRVAAWPGSPIHYLFLDEPRTRRIVCEPCAGSARMIRHRPAPGCARLKEFDFSRKRAAPRVLEREAFLARCRLA